VTNSDSSYLWTGKVIDSHSPLTTTKFNCVAFAVNTNAKTTGMALNDVKIDKGAAITLPVWVTAVETKPASNQAPSEFTMIQNYPNPFNPTTTIEFSLPKSGEVNLTVYDMNGRVAAELALGKYGAGTYKVVFDASKLASGTYLLRLNAGDFTGVRKAVLMK